MPTLSLTLDRSILEHPEAVHVRRMRSALWLYLVLLAYRPADSDMIDVDVTGTARSMGLPEGTIRSWLGHLRKHRYVSVERTAPTLRVRIKHLALQTITATPVPERFFSAAKVMRALGETADRAGIEEALTHASDDSVRKALAKTMAVPAGDIRRSRTALFLYLLKRHAEAPSHHPRP